MLDVARTRAAHAAYHAIAARAAGDGEAGAFDQLGHALQLVNRDVRAREPRLRAIVAILGTDAALRIAQNADLYAAPESGLAHGQGRREQCRQLLVGAIQNRARLRPLQFFAREHLRGHPIQSAVQIKFAEVQHLTSPQVSLIQACAVFSRRCSNANSVRYGLSLAELRTPIPDQRSACYTLAYIGYSPSFCKFD